MLDQTKKLVLDFFTALAEGERKTEEARITLNSCEDFDPYLLFNRLDQYRKNFLTEDNLIDFATLHKIDVTINQGKFLILFYDTDSDRSLNYNEFLNLVLCKDFYQMRQNVSGKYNDGLNASTYISYETENKFCQVLQSEFLLIQTIDALLADSHLPCNLGLIYNCYGSTDPVFRYAAKNEDATARIYIADDGTNALMRGYPDRHDIIMCADILFSSDRYDIDGAKVGMTFRECIDILTSKGWVLQKDSSTLVKEMLCIKLYDAVPESILSDPGTVIGSDELTVSAMRILLSASSNMEAYNPEK